MGKGTFLASFLERLQDEVSSPQQKKYAKEQLNNNFMTSQSY